MNGTPAKLNDDAAVAAARAATTVSAMRTEAIGALANPPLCLCEVVLINFEADECFYTAALRGDGGIADSEKWIEHRFNSRHAVEFNAPLRELHREGGRMRAFFRSTLNRLVRNEPGVAAAMQIAPARMRPARDVRFVLIRHADRQPIQLDARGFGEMKDVFVAVVQKSC